MRGGCWVRAWQHCVFWLLRAALFPIKPRQCRGSRSGGSSAWCVCSELRYACERCCMGAGGGWCVVRLHRSEVLAALSPVAARDTAGSQRCWAPMGPGPALAVAAGCSSPRRCPGVTYAFWTLAGLLADPQVGVGVCPVGLLCRAHLLSWARTFHPRLWYWGVYFPWSTSFQLGLSLETLSGFAWSPAAPYGQSPFPEEQLLRVPAPHLGCAWGCSGRRR